MSKVLYELGGWLWWIFFPSDLHEKLGGGGCFIFTPTWGNHPTWLIFFPKDLLRMVSWNPKTLRFVSVNFSHPERSSSDVRWARIIRVSNELVQAPPRTETDGSCGRSKKKILVMIQIKSTLSSESGKIICDVHQVGGAFLDVLQLQPKCWKTTVRRFICCCWSLPWGFPVAVMQLLDCSCVRALDPWRSKKMKQLSVGSCQWCPIFLEVFLPVGMVGW